MWCRARGRGVSEASADLARAPPPRQSRAILVRKILDERNTLTITPDACHRACTGSLPTGDFAFAARITRHWVARGSPEEQGDSREDEARVRLEPSNPCTHAPRRQKQLHRQTETPGGPHRKGIRKARNEQKNREGPSVGHGQQTIGRRQKEKLEPPELTRSEAGSRLRGEAGNSFPAVNPNDGSEFASEPRQNYAVPAAHECGRHGLDRWR